MDRKFCYPQKVLLYYMVMAAKICAVERMLIIYFYFLMFYSIYLLKSKVFFITSVLFFLLFQAQQVHIENVKNFYRSQHFRTNNFIYDSKRKLIVHNL